MKVTCTKENLSQALGLVGGVAGKNINLPILGNILIRVDNQKTEIISTNLEVAIVATLRSKVDEPGSFTVPARTLTDFVNLLSGEKVEIELQGNELAVTCDRSTTKIKGSPADDFPVVPSLSEGSGYLISAEELKTGLSQVVSALAKNDIRPELSGVFCGFNVGGNKGLILATTDSYRLAEKKIKLNQGDDEIKVIVPGRTAQEIIHILSLAANEENESGARILLNNNQIVLNYSNIQLVSRLVDGQYPDYTQIIPKSFTTTATLSTNQLSKETKAAALFTTTGVNAISFFLEKENSNVVISSTSTQTGEYKSQLEAEILGESNNILLNHRYLQDGLNNIKTPNTVFKMINADSPCLFAPQGDDSFLYIVMPIRQ
jgi:DNA polymerase-3 subunit beta